MLRIAICCLAFVLAFSISPASGGERMSPELLWKLGRLGSGIASPVIGDDRVVYTVRNYKLAENSGSSSILMVRLDGTHRRTLLESWRSVSDLQWSISPKGPQLYFLGAKVKDDKMQVWRLGPESRNLLQVTSFEEGASNLKVSPLGDRIAFTLRVQLEKDVQDLYPDLPEADAKIIDRLMYRHWDTWNDGTYSHLHVANLGPDGKAGEILDLMKNRRFDCPVPPFAGSEHYNWSPDGKEIALTAKIVKRWAESTDTDIYLVKTNGEGRFLCATVGMNGYDVEPSYSPDGRWISFLSMERPGFEADRNRIMIFDRKLRSIHEITEGLDQTVSDAAWSPDSRALFFHSETKGTNQVFRLELTSRKLDQVTEGRYNWSPRSISADGRYLVCARMSMLRPYELATVSLESGDVAKITGINDSLYAKLDLPRIEERWVRSTDTKKVHNWIIYPPDFDASKRWPVIIYCQGGPQGQIGQWFSYRWNFHLMAANGYVVAAVNRRGLPGFGREWNDSISRDWGGQAMQDILASTDSMISESFVDPERVAAVGASFGGYTVYWLMGRHERRFATMIAHCGVFNLESMYGSTEELFFVNWDLGGPYWKNRALQRDYDRFSPHRFVKNWDTPLLVIHGERDFRVPVTQGMEAFTAAQVKGVPSRFLYFPNEGHWVLKPQNGVLWHRVFFDWLDRSCKPGE